MLKRHFVLRASEETGWMLVLFAAVTLAVVCIIWLYRYERRLVSGRLGIGLMLLRLAAVAVVFAALQEPTLRWSYDKQRTGAVVIAVDLSQSMDTADRHASPAEKLRLARALDMIGSEATRDRLDRWAAAFAAGREPEWLDPQEQARGDGAGLALSRRDNLDGVFREVSRLSRREIAFRLLMRGSAPLADRLGERALVELAGFAGESIPLDRDSLERTLADPPASVRPEISNLAVGLSARLRVDKNVPVAGIVLFTDGRDNAYSEPSQLIIQARNTGVPIYPVLIGSEQRPRDLAVAGIEAPPLVYRGDAASIRVALKTAGFEGEELTVVLEQAVVPAGPSPPPPGERDGGAPPSDASAVREIARRSITPTSAATSIDFSVPPTELGRHRYRVRVELRPNETREDNNVREFVLQVVDDQSRVLVLEGAPRWEFRYLEAALRRDEHVQTSVLLFHQPYLGVLPDTFFARTLPPLPDQNDPRAVNPFADFDLIIVGDVAENDLTDAGWAWIEKYVRDGGTLVLSAGKRNMPLAYRSPVIKDLLPVEQFDVITPNDESNRTLSPEQRGFGIQLTPEGEEQPMLQFSDDAAENRRRWSELPGQMWGLRSRAKPGATVWATSLRAADPSNLRMERETALIVHAYVGSGQVLWIGIDGTWRWRHRVGDAYHHRFWGQLARWGADFKASAGNEFVKFGPIRPTVEAGQEAVVRARFSEPFLRQFPRLKARARFVPIAATAQDPVAGVELKPLRESPTVHEGRIEGLAAGEYRITLQLEHADAGDSDLTSELDVVPRTTTELSELTANPTLLKQIAEATGGRLLHPDELEALPREFAGASQTERLEREIPLWDHWLTLVIFSSLLATEWVLRKVNGLP